MRVYLKIHNLNSVFLFTDSAYIIYRDHHPSQEIIDASRRDLKHCIGDIPLVADPDTVVQHLSNSSN